MIIDRIACPHAKRTQGAILCKAREDKPCLHQYFKPCKGWWALRGSALSCKYAEQEDPKND